MGTNLDVVTLANRSFLNNAPTATVIQTTAQSVPNNTDTAITFQSGLYDNWSGFSAGTPTRYTVQISGVYAVSAAVSWAGNASGRRYHYLRRNGLYVIPGSAVDVASSGTANMMITTPMVLYFLFNTDYIEVMANQNSGGALNTATGGAASAFVSSLNLKWIHL